MDVYRCSFRTFSDNDVANDVEVFLDFTSLQAMFTIFAKVSERAFMVFPLHGTLLHRPAQAHLFVMLLTVVLFFLYYPLSLSP